MTELVKVIRAQWDRAFAAVLTVAGLLFLIFGWIGVSGAKAVVTQLPFIISGGLGGIALVAVGAALWVSSDLRDEWSEIRRLRLTVERLEAAGQDEPAEPTRVRMPEEIAAVRHAPQAERGAVPAVSRAGRDSSQAW